MLHTSLHIFHKSSVYLHCIRGTFSVYITSNLRANMCNKSDRTTWTHLSSLITRRKLRRVLTRNMSADGAQNRTKPRVRRVHNGNNGGGGHVSPLCDLEHHMLSLSYASERPQRDACSAIAVSAQACSPSSPSPPPLVLISSCCLDAQRPRESPLTSPF